ncbi:MAG: redoxin domain-containing protein [Acidobacteria bacterium]|nr:redoxin domain-containing protein [Acidobacteriota bacterium]
MKSVVARTARFLGATPHTAALALLLLVSLSINLTLARTVTNLNRRVARNYSTAGRVLQAGDPAPPFVARGVDAAQVEYVFSDVKRTMVYVFSPQCAWCEKNLDNLKALVAHADGAFDVLAVSLQSEGVAAYLAERDLSVTTLVEPSDDTRAAYRLGATPTTFVVGPQRTVEKVWIGAFDGAAATEIEAFFGVRLPGLRNP